MVYSKENPSYIQCTLSHLYTQYHCLVINKNREPERFKASLNKLYRLLIKKNKRIKKRRVTLVSVSSLVACISTKTVSLFNFKTQNVASGMLEAEDDINISSCKY